MLFRLFSWWTCRVECSVLEYWPFGKHLHVKPVDDGKVTMRSVGYKGEAGLYRLDTCVAANSTVWWDYFKTYTAKQVGGSRKKHLNTFAVVWGN